MPIYVKANKVKSDHAYTQFPITINDATDSSVPEWSLFGNGSQTGTPSPQSIIMPTFCGVRTGNLFDPNSTRYHMGKAPNNTIGSAPNAAMFYIKADADMTYTIKVHASDSTFVRLYLSDAQIVDGVIETYSVISESETVENPEVSITNTNYAYLWIQVGGTWYTEHGGASIMLNLGTTALPYEPYGWAEKITCTGQKTPVYLGQVRTVRRVNRLVLTGAEEWQFFEGVNIWQFYINNVGLGGVAISSCVSNIAPYGVTADTRQTYDYGCYLVTAGNGLAFQMKGAKDTFTSITAWKSYLSAKYAAGNPVTVWYVLATPTTGVVNEPLAKIGDYADELSSADAGVTLTLQTGTSNTISIESDLQPSKMNISYYSEGYTDAKKIPMSGDREVKHVLDANGLYVYKSPNYYNWQNIRDIVRAGKGETYYPVGSIIYDNFDSSTGTAFQVVAHDHHFDPTLTAQGYTHSMTLCEVELTDVITFDAVEAFIYTDTVMPAGTYKFKIPNYDAAYGGNKTYCFTSTADLPAGSQIVMSWAYQHPPASVTAYSGATPWNSTTAVTGFNALPLTEWDESVTATDLGTIAGAKTELGHSDFGTMNHIHRARYSSNNYLQSGLRQYINSDGAANAWWQAQTVFDRPYGSRSSAGKLTKLNADMVAVMAKPEIQSITNSYFETTSFDGTTFTLSTNYTITTDKMFLLSPMEVNFNTTDTTVGSVLDYYVNADNAKRIKYRKSNGSAYYWWFRTPNPSNASGVRSVDSSGAWSNYGATSSYGVASACVIQ